ncbi:hypothetical protein P0136_05615 [Lentisphaerota bacterium ZTH]|nr:hypothetical protein JYG24_03270 [Lentisphaerota bacterium]WET07469.1 hypothetical protein P0136_05615 [Lentisphaerota bacterium ZTH]
MRKSLYVVIFFFVVFLSATVSRAEKCSKCGKEADLDNVDSLELEFRQMYLDKVKDYISSKHSGLINSNSLLTMDILCELFNIPARKALYEDDDTFELLKQAEDQLQAERMNKSIGDTLPYEKVRADIRDTLPGLRLEDDFQGWLYEAPQNGVIGFALNDLKVKPEVKIERVCNKCRMFELDLNYNELKSLNIKLPTNIQLALKLDKIVKSSDIVILLSTMNAADHLLQSYLRLFSNERFVLGLDAYDGSPDWSNPEINKQVLEAVHETINKQCDNNFPPVLSTLITEFGFPTLTFDKYHPTRSHVHSIRFPYGSVDFANMRENIVSFLEARCPNAVCFGAATAITHLANYPDYDKLLEQHYDLLKTAHEQCYTDGRMIPTLEEFKTSGQRIAHVMSYSLIDAKVVRDIMTDKICNYYKAINSSPYYKVPFILLLDEQYGVWVKKRKRDYSYMVHKYSDSEKEMLIQNLIKDKLSKMGLKNQKVTTILVECGPPTIFSKEKNELLNDYCLDFVVRANRLPSYNF